MYKFIHLFIFSMYEKFYCKLNYALAGANLGLFIFNILRFIILRNFSLIELIAVLIVNIVGFVVTIVNARKSEKRAYKKK